MPTIITPDDLVAMAPEFEADGQERVTTFIEIAREFVSERSWGPRYKRGVLLAAAHFLTLSRPGGERVVTSESVGELSRTYDSSGSEAGGGEDWDRTSWGLLFKTLAGRNSRFTPRVV